MNKILFLLITKDKEIINYFKTRIRNYDEIKFETDVKSGIALLQKKEFDVVLISLNDKSYRNEIENLNKEKKNKFFIGNIVDNDKNFEESYYFYNLNKYNLDLNFTDMIKEIFNKKNKKTGIYDYLRKPITKEDFEKVLTTIYQSLTTPIKKEDIIENVKNTRFDGDSMSQIIGESIPMQNMKKMIDKVAPTNLTVLIIGESGVGKELISKRVFEKSKRNNKPYIAVNCAAISSTLIEAELFGHEKGSFTGANFSRKGLIEEANEGTIFLDEIGDMELKSQAKLLRVIENGELKKVGGNETIKVDVRFIAATNKNLEDEVKKGNFREDLYFRLMNFPIIVPSLRERKEDLPIMINYFFRSIRKNMEKEDMVLSEKAIKELLTYDYPGNVRELISLLERMIVLSDTYVIEEVYFVKKNEEINYNSIKYLIDNDILDINHVEKALIIKALENANQNKVEAAKLLGIGRTTLYDKIKKYNIDNTDNTDNDD
ncbi:MAG: sigma-54-dependent Fis family transcriptional regulator [Fusobacteria bacterium]|nr:sigma-54-dependent Fis family transcriptional regulator [Fusobacteriota bacterium]